MWGLSIKVPGPRRLTSDSPPPHQRYTDPLRGIKGWLVAEGSVRCCCHGYYCVESNAHLDHHGAERSDGCGFSDEKCGEGTLVSSSSPFYPIVSNEAQEAISMCKSLSSHEVNLLHSLAGLSKLHLYFPVRGPHSTHPSHTPEVPGRQTTANS
ncbi:hypothetical protein E2C01_059230 [Portunus trituberculatus]|uniref:Uncharacterized protein n=1 Tax=Portunus trituberculatus TaxID=210409 RepID=A0A5B7H4S9_PORTR|nr:hypothetical protein [Portunus trituberculatus]